MGGGPKAWISRRNVFGSTTVESDPFVPFTYGEFYSALRLEVQANDDDRNMLTRRLVINYRAERHVFTFAVSMLRRMFREARHATGDLT